VSSSAALDLAANAFARRATQQSAQACAHCALPVPSGLVKLGAERQFCCHGCRSVYAILHEMGLARYYQLQEGNRTAAKPARVSGRGFAEFDDPAFQALYCRAQSDGLCSTELFLEGVHCAACVWLVEKLPRVRSGVVETSLNLTNSLVRVVWDPSRTPLSHVARTLDALGYCPHPARDAAARQARKREERAFLTRIAVAGACAGNAMLLALALYSGGSGGIQAEYALFFRWLSMLVGLVALAWPGSLFFRGAWAAIRTRTPHLDLPIALGLGVGAVSGAACTIFNVGEVYFDSLTVLVFLLLVGRWIQYRQQRGAADALELLFALTPTSARLVEGEAVREIPIEAVQVGALLDVRAGDSIPADGVVASGRSLVDQSLLTGESRPITVGEGDSVCAGTVNLASGLRVRANAAGAATRVGKLMRLVQDCAARRPAIVRFTDRIAGWFVAVVLILAAITVAAWAPFDIGVATNHATALLIVTCPCALGLATPLAVTVAIGRAARRDILVRGGDALERLARPGTLLLDKTGTITLGRMSVVQWRGPQELQPLIAALESHSNHPVAQALVAAFGHRADRTLDVSAAEHSPRGGMRGEVEGRSLSVGSQDFVSVRDFAPPAWLAPFERELIAAGLTPVRVARDLAIVAVAGLGDAVRPDSRDAIARLREAGWEVRLLSGDRPEIVDGVARQVGVRPADARGGATPEQKLAAVKDAMRRGPVVMVGDGVNDAAALSAATVGIAVHGGAEASLAAADIYLNRPGLSPLVDLVGAAESMMRTIRRSLTVSLLYNGLAAGLAMGGIINPLLAAILMPISSFTVITLAFSQRRPARSAPVSSAEWLPCP
jgi:Cu2+-exporting ATPase